MFTSPLWNLLLALTWGFAFLFYIFSDLLFPFFLFPWLAAGTLIPISWLIGSAFEMGDLANTILFALWGLVLSGASEIINRFVTTRKYSLPILLASIPVLGFAVISGFYHTAPLRICRRAFCHAGLRHPAFHPSAWMAVGAGIVQFHGRLHCLLQPALP